jgi:hypothetical protein
MNLSLTIKDIKLIILNASSNEGKENSPSKKSRKKSEKST